MRVVVVVQRLFSAAAERKENGCRGIGTECSAAVRENGNS